MTRRRTIRSSLAAGCALALAACGTTRAPAQPAPAPFAAGDPEPVLYARDGSVVPVDGSARTADLGAPIHGLEPRGESRMQILDLYQRAVGEKDALAKELRELDLTLADARAAQDAAARERDEERARAAALEQELARAREQQNELAARLTTAQIRRLEAEKLLLETRLALARSSERADDLRVSREAQRSPHEGARGSAKPPGDGEAPAGKRP